MGVLFYKFVHDKRLVCLHAFTQNTDERVICRRPDRNTQISGGHIDDVIDQFSVSILIDKLLCHICIDIAGIYDSVLDCL